MVRETRKETETGDTKKNSNVFIKSQNVIQKMISAADACLIQDGIIQLPSAQPEYDKIIAEIKRCITETREHGKHHAKFVQDNGELYISGLEMALSIIEENR